MIKDIRYVDCFLVERLEVQLGSDRLLDRLLTMMLHLFCRTIAIVSDVGIVSGARDPVAE